MKFDQYQIAGGIKKSIAKLGYKKPTDIQYKAIPNILKGEDLLAIAQTGTGKTAAFAIPTISLIQDRKRNAKGTPVRALVMAPTHELAQQIADTYDSLAKHTTVKTLCIHGGKDQDPQIKTLKKGVDVVVATPGRLFDLVSQGHLDLTKLHILILDEADHMLDLGFIQDIRDLMRHVPKKRQTLFFSATINEEIKKLAYSLVKNAIRIQISPKDPVAKNINHAVSFIEMDDKRFFLEGLVENNPEAKMVVFVRTKVRAERVKKALERVNIESDTIHSGREQKDREQTMKQFRKGSLSILITTDVTARGIDIPNVDIVVNYDLPEQPEQYVHRVGRTGRGTAKGQAISFCSTEEKELLQSIEDTLGKDIERIAISRSEYQQTIDLSQQVSNDWKSLMKDAEVELGGGKGSKKKKKKQ